MSRFILDNRKKYESDETLEEVVRRNCECPIPGSVQGQIRWGFKKPVLVKDVPIHCRAVGTGLFLRSLPTQTTL